MKEDRIGVKIMAKFHICMDGRCGILGFKIMLIITVIIAICSIYLLNFINYVVIYVIF